MQGDSAETQDSYAAALQELAAALRELHNQQGAPTYRGIAARSDELHSGLGQMSPISPSLIHQMMSGRASPRSVDRLLGLVRVLLSFDNGKRVVPPAQDDPRLQVWVDRWRALQNARAEAHGLSSNATTVVVTGDNYGTISQGPGTPAPTPSNLAEQRQKFHFDFLNHTLKQAEWTFRLSVWFMTGGAVVILAGAVLALVHAGNPDLSYLPLVTSLTGALITVGGGALALHSKRTMANLTKAAEDNESKIDIDHKLEVATTFIDRVGDPGAKDRLNSAAAMKALGMDAAPETMVNRLLPEQPKEIEPGDASS